MNYRHAYHAGNFADLHKHAALLLLLTHLLKKPSAFHVHDCHAGIGRYDLQADAAGKTLEYRDGILRVYHRDDAALAPYLDRVRAENGAALRYYPGSPRLIRGMLRPIDRMTLVELHPEDFATLQALFQRDRQVRLRREDAYQSLKALLPPTERRGLVLIDPPYEAEDEAHRLTQGLAEALRRWPTGIYLLWYPIKAIAAVERFKAELANFGRPCLTSELMRSAEGADGRLNGSGLAVINPPWQSDDQMAAQLTILHDALECRGKSRMQWLVNG